MFSCSMVKRLRSIKVLFLLSLVVWACGLCTAVRSIDSSRSRRTMYARVELFVAPPAATEGARIPNPRPCRAITLAGKEIVYLSSKESVASSEHELKPSRDVFAGVLRGLGVEHEEKRPERVAKKKDTVAGGAASKKVETASAASDVVSGKGTARFHQSNLEDFVYVADSFEELYAIGGKSQGGATAAARSSGNAGSKGPNSGATPTSVHIEETEVEPDAEELTRKNASMRSCVETKTVTAPLLKRLPIASLSGRKGALGVIILKSHQVVTKKPDALHSPKTVVADEGKIGEVTKAGEKETDAAKAGKQPIDITSKVKAGTAGGGGAGGSGGGAIKEKSGKKPRSLSPIRADDTLGDIYYKSYDDSCASEIRDPVWNFKQRDTFAEFGACREWMMGAFPIGEVRHQKECLL
ncbi:hypothetical protein Hanom_Chr03g00227651 [Helianthus anomalus]